VLGGERLGEVVDVLRREGLARDGSLCLFDGVDCTSIPQFSNTLPDPLTKPSSMWYPVYIGRR
jgi:hypothetical protein